MKDRIHYNHLANLFRYPDESYRENVQCCVELLKLYYPEAYTEIFPFHKYINENDIYDIEEVFVKTFHIQAICFLDLGYVLFAEDYKRGDFLVKVKNEQRKVNNDCGEELADNLPNILTLMVLLEDEEFLSEFAVRIVKPAIEKMLEEFDVSRMELRDSVLKKKHKVLIQQDLKNKNIFQYALQALYSVIKKDFVCIEYNDPAFIPLVGGNFLKSCNSGCSTTAQLLKNN